MNIVCPTRSLHALGAQLWLMKLGRGYTPTELAERIADVFTTFAAWRANTSWLGKLGEVLIPLAEVTTKRHHVGDGGLLPLGIGGKREREREVLWVTRRGAHQTLHERHLRARREGRHRERAGDAEEFASLDSLGGDDAATRALAEVRHRDGADVIGASAEGGGEAAEEKRGHVVLAHEGLLLEHLALRERVLRGLVLGLARDELPEDKDGIRVATEAVERHGALRAGEGSVGSAGKRVERWGEGVESIGIDRVGGRDDARGAVRMGRGRTL